MPQLNKGGKFIFGLSVIRPDLTIHFPPQSTLSILNLQSGMELLSIRSSDIAFTIGAKGPLLEKACNFQGDIERY